MNRIVIPGEQKSRLEQIECPSELEKMEIEVEPSEPESSLTEDQVRRIIDSGEEQAESSSEVDMTIKKYVEDSKQHNIKLRKEMLDVVLSGFVDDKAKLEARLLKIEGRMTLYPLLNSSADISLWKNILVDLAECDRMIAYINGRKTTFFKRLLFWK